MISALTNRGSQVRALHRPVPFPPEKINDLGDPRLPRSDCPKLYRASLYRFTFGKNYGKVGTATAAQDGGGSPLEASPNHHNTPFAIPFWGDSWHIRGAQNGQQEDTMTNSKINPEREERMREIVERADKSLDPIERKIARPVRSLLRAIERNKRAHERLEKVVGKGR